MRRQEPEGNRFVVHPLANRLLRRLHHPFLPFGQTRHTLVVEPDRRRFRVERATRSHGGKAYRERRA